MITVENENISNIYISLNYKCNNKCLMCGVKHIKHNQFNYSVQFYVEKLREIPFKISKQDIMTISGGEPLLFKQFFEFIEYIRANYDTRISIFTNGRLLSNEDNVNKLKQIGIWKVIIPFFSNDQETFNCIVGSNKAYQECILGLKNLEKYKVNYELKFIPMKLNYKQLLDTYKYCKNQFSNCVFTICGMQYFGEVLNNIEKIDVKYSTIAPYIEDVFEYAKSKYNETIPLYRYPMCTLDACYLGNAVHTLFKEYIISPDYSDVNVDVNNRPKYKIPTECQTCITYCNWYSSKYINIHGVDEFISF